jgi:hypothetical protein
MEETFKSVTKLVKRILEVDEKARNSDDYLYCMVAVCYGLNCGIDISKVSMVRFFGMRNEWDIPGFETVRRSRQKIQQHYPELRAKKEVDDNRQMRELQFEEYARGAV